MNFVRPNGNAPARVMLVGDYPTEAEVSTGSSFTGASSDTLIRLFKSTGLDFRTMWKTHYYKTQIPGWNSPNEAVKKKALVNIEKSGNWAAVMAKEIDVIKPNLIISMGELAMYGLTGMRNLSKRAGSFYQLRPVFNQTRPIRVLAVHSTRQLFISPEEYLLTPNDLRKGLPFVDACPPWKDDYDLVIGKKPMLVREWLRNYNNKKAQFGVFDVETCRNLVTCICFCFDGKHSISIPLLDRSLPTADIAALWYYVYYTLISGVPWVNQNIKYDMGRLESMKFQIGPVIGDTMLRASIIYPELPKGLDFLTRLYTNVGYYKDEGKEFDAKIHDFNRMLLYNAKDGITTFRVYEKQEKELKTLGLQKANSNLQKAFFIYREMEDRGIRVDDKIRKELIQFYDHEILMLESELDQIAGRKMNAKSGDQIGPLLIELGANPKIRTWDEEKGKFKYKTGKIELEDMYVNVSDNKFLGYVARLGLTIRKLYKLRQFCDYIAHREGQDYIVRTSFKLHGTETGRSATGKLLESIYYQFPGEKPDWEQPGFSIQQQPKHPWKYEGREYGKEFRKQFVPRPGYVFVEFDLSQAEARVVDVLAEDYDSLAEYGRLDKHCKTASIVTGVDYDDLVARRKAGDFWAQEERQRGKSYKHGSNYKESAFNLSRRTHIPFRDVELALKRIDDANPKIRNVFHRTIDETLGRTRVLKTSFGRARTFFGHMNDKLFKEGYSYIPQSTIPDHLRVNILFHLKREAGHYANFLVEWHDSLMAEVLEYKVQDYKELAQHYAKTPITFREGTFIRDYELVIPIDFAMGQNWYDMKGF